MYIHLRHIQSRASRRFERLTSRARLLTTTATNATTASAYNFIAKTFISSPHDVTSLVLHSSLLRQLGVVRLLRLSMPPVIPLPRHAGDQPEREPDGDLLVKIHVFRCARERRAVQESVFTAFIARYERLHRSARREKRKNQDRDVRSNSLSSSVASSINARWPRARAQKDDVDVFYRHVNAPTP